MAIRLTNHAKLRIESRKIRKKWIESIVSGPLLTDSDSKDLNIIHYYGKIGERVLRIVGKTLNGDILIITAFFDRGMRGKL